MGKPTIGFGKHQFFNHSLGFVDTSATDHTATTFRGVSAQSIDPLGKQQKVDITMNCQQTLENSRGRISFKDEDFNLHQLQTEFSSLYQIFLSNKHYRPQEFEMVFYLSYLCDLLIHYYQQDYVHSELNKLKQKKEELDAFLKKELGILAKQESIKNFPDFILHAAKENILGYISSCVSISEFRNMVGNLNANRSQFVYSRGLASSFIHYIQYSTFSECIQEMNQFLGNQFSFAEGINVLNESRAAITNLGIVLYVLRFFINLILIIKHIIQSSINKELSVNKVLQQELEKRGFIMASDLVWAVVSLLTTYNQFFHVASSAIPTITMSFLIFDALLLLAQWFFETRQYQQRMAELAEQKDHATKNELAIIQRQIDVINDEWEVRCAYFALNILAANIIAVSFAISLICTGPLALAGVAFFCMLGNALYNSSDEYSYYQKAKIAIKREQANGLIVADAHHQELLLRLNEESSKKYIQFWETLALNFGGLALIITAAVASWPVAVGLALIYIGYRLNDAYQKQLRIDDNTAHDVYRLIKIEESENTNLCPLLC